MVSRVLSSGLLMRLCSIQRLGSEARVFAALGLCALWGRGRRKGKFVVERRRERGFCCVDETERAADHGSGALQGVSYSLSATLDTFKSNK